MSAALTESIDVAQVVLYAFWLFFFGLIFWLRREDRREGYPCESDNPRGLLTASPVLIPPPKTFLLQDGSTVEAPNFKRDEGELPMRRISAAAGSPSEPTGDGMGAGVGPGAWVAREDHPEKTREGHDAIVPMRVATDYAVSAGPDPRGWNVVGSDGEVAGKVKDIWIDRADVMVRYFEVELSGGGSRLLPVTMLKIARDQARVEVGSVRAAHFASVPRLRNESSVTVREEEQICAFYAGGRLYSDPSRMGPLV